MRTLYVSDLDGTLLRSDETVSDRTAHVIRELTHKGMLFSFATARSFVTARKVTKGICAGMPVIVYNGAFVMDGATGEILSGCRFGGGVQGVLDDLFGAGVYPIVYAFVDGAEKFSFVPGLCTPGMEMFLNTRMGDVRRNAVSAPDALRQGDIFYITCIDAPEKLLPLYEKYKDRYHCVYYTELYTKAQWLEIMPLEATKANAVLRLKSMLGCGRVVVFGDAKNDIDMFSIADERYAVANADEELKRLATGIIAANDDDGVARWLEEHAQY